MPAIAQTKPNPQTNPKPLAKHKFTEAAIIEWKKYQEQQEKNKISTLLSKNILLKQYHAEKL